MLLSEEEQNLVSLGAKRYQHKLEQLKENNLISLTSLGNTIIRKSIKPVANRIESYSETIREGCLLPIEQLAFIGLTTVINYLEPEMKFSTLCFKVGSFVVDEYNAQQLKVPDNLTRNQLIKRLRKYKPTVIKKSQRLRIGTLILASIESETNLIEFKYKIIRNRKYRVVSPTLQFIQNYDDFMRETLYSSPIKKPIPSFPIQFDDSLIGGYAFDVLKNVSSLKYRNKSQIKLLQDKGNVDKVKNVLNTVQSIPYEISEEILDVAWNLYTNDKSISGLPGNLKEIPKLDKDVTDEEKATYLRKFYQLKDYNNSILGKRFNVARTLMIAKESAELDHFYFPCYVDFRGRIYYHGDYLNPQGADLSKSLLLFKSKAVIKENYWYYVHIANCFGHSKYSYLERYNWVVDNSELIEAIGDKPLSYLDLWKDAKEPFSYLGCCIDFAAYIKNPDTYESGLRICADGTASGLQILSLLLGDKEGCKRTNVIA